MEQSYINKLFILFLNTFHGCYLNTETNHFVIANAKRDNGVAG